MTCGGAWARGGSGRPGLRMSLRELARSFPTILPLVCNYQNLAQTLHCLAVLLHLVGGPLLDESVKHAKGTQMSR